jgi:glycosyltransferase involved in cell wall biosynthesis
VTLPSTSGSTVAAVFVGDHPDLFLPTLAALRRTHPGLPVVVGAPHATDLTELEALGTAVVRVATPAGLFNAAARRPDAADGLLVIGEPVLLPAGTLERAQQLQRDDVRVATVSFWSNAAGQLSFPHWATPSSHHLGNSLDEQVVSQRLRERSPELGVVPVHAASGGAVFISAEALAIVGDFSEHDRFGITLLDFTLRAQGHGLRNALDPATYLTRPIDLVTADGEPGINGAERHWLLANHPTVAEVALEQPTPDSPLGMAFQVARTKVNGLRVAIDATTLGPTETGTQVQTLALIDALVRRDDVATVGVALGGPVPAYAEQTLHDRKVRASWCSSDDFTPLGDSDIVHRPFQPDRPLDVESWRRTGTRTLLTIQDLIYYEVGAYHSSPADWERVRASVRQAVRDVDGVVVIAHDVAQQIADERLAVESQRLFVVENGTDHLSGDEPASVPPGLSAGGLVGGPFALVLGTNYGHKNRHLAIEAVRLLHEAGTPLELIMAGPTVPRGSTRVAESRASLRPGAHVHLLPDVTSRERNWLLRHAALVLYPTSAEGFGLVPYEAARFGTATVHVSFGPLAEVAPDLPVAAAGWAPAELAEACLALLSDPDLYQAQLKAVLRAAETYTWDRTAELLVSAYRQVLSRPRR